LQPILQLHEFKMLSRGTQGSMVYEPDYLHIAPGSTVKFVATRHA
jgi:plastocyanin